MVPNTSKYNALPAIPSALSASWFLQFVEIPAAWEPEGSLIRIIGGWTWPKESRKRYKVTT